ncbi:MAG TPA: MAPEG family protein [Oxalicibacterium sp.]|nr:MAPEG family protein [Oxalicibacterium sp.]
MTLAYWSILIAGLLPAVTVAIAKFGAKDFDNNAPRNWLEKQQGVRSRADAAHRNHFEAFPFFAAGILVAQLCHVPQGRIDMLAATFIVLRVVYTALYLADRATLRSLCWALGYLCVIALFVLSGLQG